MNTLVDSTFQDKHYRESIEIGRAVTFAISVGVLVWASIVIAVVFS